MNDKQAAGPTPVEAAQAAVMDAFLALAADADSPEANANADAALQALDALLD